MKARTTLLRKLKDVFRRHQSQPVDRVVYLINPILRGWVNYYRVGNSSKCFGYVKDWVEKKIRRHLMYARKRRGFGWNRWNRAWLYETLGLYNDYGVRHCRAWKCCQFDRSYNPWGEDNRESLVREIRTLGLSWRGLETGPWVPRQPSTLPVRAWEWNSPGLLDSLIVRLSDFRHGWPFARAYCHWA